MDSADEVAVATATLKQEVSKFLERYLLSLREGGELPSPDEEEWIALLSDKHRAALHLAMKNARDDLASTDRRESNAAETIFGPLSTTDESGREFDGISIHGIEIIRELARGGMGVAYLARDLKLNRNVVVKVLREEFRSRADLVHRFQAEAQLTAQLLHLGVPPIHDVGELADGRPFLIMKLVEGRTLAEVLREGREGTEHSTRLQAIFAQICQVVAYAHSQGVIHRDLKPANIMVEPFDAVQILDWGLAKVLREESDQAIGSQPQSGGISTVHSDDARFQSEFGDLIGTVQYMSPEAARTEVRELDERCDVFGLGAILCEILTGGPPFIGDDRRDILEKARRGDLAAAYESLDRCGADAELVQLTKACLAADPEPRPLHAGVVSDSITAYHTGLEERKREAELEREKAEATREEAEARAAAEAQSRREAVGREQHQRRAKRWALVAAGLTVLLAAGTVGIFALQQQRDHRLRMQADEILADGEGSLASRPEDARDRALAVQALVGGQASFVELERRAVQLAQRADGKIEHRKEVETIPSAFRKEIDEAEFHVLGSLWTLMPHEDPKAKRRIPRSLRTGATLTAGIEILQRALHRYGLHESSRIFDELPNRGYDEPLIEDLRLRAADGLFLLALAVERSSQGGDSETLRDGRIRAVSLFDLAEQLDNRTKSLYKARAGVFESLGRSEQAVADRKNAELLAPVTFLDHHFLAGESQRAGRLEEAAESYRAALALRPRDFWTLFRLAKTTELLGQREQVIELYQQAIGLYQSCISLRPDDPTAYNNRGDILTRVQQWDSAIADFKQAIQLDPDYFPAVNNLMLALAERTDVDAARAVRDQYRATRQRTPVEEAELLNTLGIAYERAGRLEQAVSYYSEALANDGEFVLALRNRSILLSKSGRFSEAESDLKKAISLEPKNSDLYYVLGNNFAAAGQTDEAVQAYEESIELNPRVKNAAYNRGVLLRKPLARFQEAIESQTLVLTSDPPPELEVMALYERAMCHANLNALRAALDDLNVILAKYPGDRDALLTRGKVLGDLKDLEGSEQDLDLFVRLSPNAPEGYRARGLTRFRSDNWSGAIDDYRKYLESTPEASDAESIQNDIGTGLMELGKLEEAEAVYESIKDASLPSTMSNRGNLAMKRGNLTKAMNDFNSAIEADPDHTRAWALRGQAWLRQDRFDLASADLDKALELEPDVYETMLFAGLVDVRQGDEAAARARLEPIVRDRPNHVRGRMAQGLLDLLDQSYARAIARLSAAEGDETLHPFALRARARCWIELGAPGLTMAIQDAEEVATTLSTDSRAQFEAARICVLVAARSDETAAAKARSRALELLQRAITIEPEIRNELATDPDVKSLSSDPALKQSEENL